MDGVLKVHRKKKGTGRKVAFIVDGVVVVVDVEGRYCYWGHELCRLIRMVGYLEKLSN